MIRDTHSNSLVTVGLSPASQVPGTYETEIADHSLANSASFHFNVGAITGTLDAQIQYSDDNITWTDDDGESGNVVTFPQVTASGDAHLEVFNPRGRYSRAEFTVTGTSVMLAVTIIKTPLRTVTPA